MLTVQYAVNEMLANQQSRSNHIEQCDMVKKPNVAESNIESIIRY